MGRTGVGRPGCGRGQLSTLASRSVLVGVGGRWLGDGVSVLMGLTSWKDSVSDLVCSTLGVSMF